MLVERGGGPVLDLLAHDADDEVIEIVLVHGLLEGNERKCLHHALVEKVVGCQRGDVPVEFPPHFHLEPVVNLDYFKRGVALVEFLHEAEAE